MTKGYLVCCQYRHRGWDPDEDAFHIPIVFTSREDAINELHNVYNEQKNIVQDNLDENEELFDDDFDPVTGTFSVHAMFGNEHSDGLISEVSIK